MLNDKRLEDLLERNILMQVLYGTTNQAKLHSMRRIAEVLDIEIIGLKELNKPIPAVDECGKDPLENAKLKAQIYYKTFQMPVFSCDSGLYFEQLEDSVQPGTHVRRINGKELTDEEMIAHYANLARQHNGKLLGNYKNAIYFIYDETHVFSRMDESIMTEPFLLVGRPHEKRIEGFPLDSLSVEISSMSYYFDLENRSVVNSAIGEGFKDFFKGVLAEVR